MSAARSSLPNESRMGSVVLSEIGEALWLFFDRGGPALWAILAASMWLWTRIGQGYAFVHRAQHGQHDAPAALHVALDLGRRVQEMESLIAVLPLLGLLGTIGGMIEAFDVLAYSGSTFGTSDPRGLSLGISRALLTTMAGLVTSLAGVFAVTPLARRVARANRSAQAGDAGRDGFALSPLLSLRVTLLGRARHEEAGS
jgi:biopolymer transport protein ExbB